jgi:hypothetical protein
MGRVSKRDTKMFRQLVQDCMFYGLNEDESLIYIKKRTGGLKISRSNFYNIKKRISENEEEIVQERLTEHGRIGIALKLFEIIDSIERVQTFLFQSLREEFMKPMEKRNLFSVARIATNILENSKFLRLLSIDIPFVKQIRAEIDKAREIQRPDDEPVVE